MVNFLKLNAQSCCKLILFSTILCTVTACVVSQPAAPAPIINGWKQNAADSSSYRVQPGDTVYSIAWTYGMDYKDLVSYNQLSEPYALREGQILRMSPASAALTPPPSAAVVTPVPPSPSFASSSETTRNPPVTSVPEAESVPPVIEEKPQPVEASAPSLVKTPVTTTTKVTAWQWPTKGSVVKKFSASSRGIDIAGKSGQAVVAAASGKVVYAGSGLKGYGNLIIIKHNDDELSAYAFNKSLTVKEGDSVTGGQRIASMGKDDDGKPVLHFEIRRNGKPVNPMTYLQ